MLYQRLKGRVGAATKRGKWVARNIAEGCKFMQKVRCKVRHILMKIEVIKQGTHCALAQSE